MQDTVQEAQDENAPLNVMEENLFDLKKKLMTLEWDKSHNQLNSGMEAKYAQIKTAYEELQKKVSGAKAELRENEAAGEAAEEKTETATITAAVEAAAEANAQKS